MNIFACSCCGKVPEPAKGWHHGYIVVCHCDPEAQKFGRTAEDAVFEWNEMCAMAYGSTVTDEMVDRMWAGTLTYEQALVEMKESA